MLVYILKLYLLLHKLLYFCCLVFFSQLYLVYFPVFYLLFFLIPLKLSLLFPEERSHEHCCLRSTSRLLPLRNIPFHLTSVFIKIFSSVEGVRSLVWLSAISGNVLLMYILKLWARRWAQSAFSFDTFLIIHSPFKWFSEHKRVSHVKICSFFVFINNFNTF